MQLIEMHREIIGIYGSDPIIFMRFVRLTFLILAGILILFEPMTCGGRNRAFHRILAGLFFAGAWVSYTMAQARMTVIVANPTDFFKNVPQAGLFWSEFVFTAFALIVTARLVYDTYMYHRLRILGCSAACGRMPRVDCLPHSEEREDADTVPEGQHAGHEGSQDYSTRDPGRHPGRRATDSDAV